MCKLTQMFKPIFERGPNLKTKNIYIMEMTSLGSDRPAFSFCSICLSPLFGHINRKCFRFERVGKMFRLDSKTPAGSLTERDREEKSSPPGLVLPRGGDKEANRRILIRKEEKIWEISCPKGSVQHFCPKTLESCRFQGQILAQIWAAAPSDVPGCL